MKNVKVRLPEGNLAVYTVDDQHQTYDAVTMYGRQRAKQFGGTWRRVGMGQLKEPLECGNSLGIALSVQEVEALPVSFEVPHPMFGMQVLVPAPYDSTQKVWTWVRPSKGDPYQFHTEEEASRNLAMCYPDAIRSEVRVAEFATM